MCTALFGGTPQYLLQMSDKLSIEDNIKNTFLNPNSALFEEPENLLKQEVREPALYNAIITRLPPALPVCRRFPERLEKAPNICSALCEKPVSPSALSKKRRLMGKVSRKAVYSIADNMSRFWYRFVPENNSIIARGAADLAYKRIEPYLSDYMGKVFEEICNRANVPYQIYVNRSDILGGSTLGNISTTQVPVNTVDIGLAQLAMHSPYETGSVKDTDYMIQAMKTFFEASVRQTEDGYEIISR